MRVFLALGALATAAAGCHGSGQPVDTFAGLTKQTVILRSAPLVLGEHPVVLTAPRPLAVVGKQANVCLALRGDLPLGPREVMDKAYEAALGGTEVTAVFSFKGGGQVDASCTNQAWNRVGEITHGPELLACVQFGCAQTLPIGVEIERISLRATKPVRVLGAYWESANTFDNIKPPR